MTRRGALGAIVGTGLVASGLAACSPSEEPAPTPSGRGRRFGAEWDHHARTFMSWPALTSVWGKYLPDVRDDIARVARAVAEFEHVVMLARPDQSAAAQRACGSGVEVVDLPVDDLWARDTVPVFVEDQGGVLGVDLGFNGWGKKQEHTNDAAVGAALLPRYGVPRVRAPFTAEGGSFETDGEGTLLVTESSIVNDNRNPGKSRDQIEAELKKTLGIKKVIWLKGVRGQDITDAHVDSLVRFTAPGTVLLDTPFPGSPPDSWSRSADQAREVLSTTTDADGRPIQIIDLPQPDPDETAAEDDDFVSTYANFFIANGAVFIPAFGDRPADDTARAILADHFPGREIVPVQIDTIASGGGGIHCATHDMPG